jgi:hypothetical protein
MRKIHWLTSSLTLAGICLSDSLAFSQSYPAPYRTSGGWRPSQSVGANPAGSGATSGMQSAFYQAANPPALPAFPGDPYGHSMHQPDGAAVMPPALPSMPNALNAAPASMPSFPPQLYGAEGMAPGLAYGAPDYAQPMPTGQSSGVYPAQNQPQQYYPPQNTSPFQTVATGNELRAVSPSMNSAHQQPANQVRATNASVQTGFGPGIQTQPIATGLPYVTPAPRTGRYPTSQYNPAYFQTVSYQTTQPVAGAPPVLPPVQATGIYPTAYQQCSPSNAAVYPPAGSIANVPPTLPPNAATNTYSPNNSGYTPVVSLGQENYNVTLGRGIVGQPTVYVPGQPIRNFMRYLSP